MPLTPAGLAGTISTAMAGLAMTGVEIPRFALGIGTGVCLWTSSTLVVATVDIGTLGAGVGTFPCTIPQPLLLAGLTTGFASAGLVGVSSVPLITALANGLALGFPQGLITTAHSSVGVGVGTATFPGPSSIPSITTGLLTSGFSGTSLPQLAAAIGMGLDIAFAGFVIPVPIVGPPSPFPSGGVGVGKIV